MPDDHAQDELAFLRDIEVYENSELLKDLLPKAYSSSYRAHATQMFPTF